MNPTSAKTRLAVFASHPWTLAGLFASVLVMQCVGRTAEWPIAVMALGGLWVLGRERATVFRDPMLRVFFGVFGCLWLPMVLAQADAVNFGRSLETTLGFLRFALMAVFIRYAYAHERHFGKMLAVVTVVLGFWAVDGLVQSLTGVNLLGYPAVRGQLTGMFHPYQRLAHHLVVFSPLFVLGVMHWGRGKAWSWLALAVYAAVIVLSGKRGPWIMLAGALALWGMFAACRLPPRKLLAVGVLVLGLGGAGLVGLSQHPDMRAKVAQTSGLLSGEFQAMNQASGHRLEIWRTALAILAAHWVNGIGPRSFRDGYPDYAQPDELYMQINSETGPLHAHQIVLEIGAETGVIGLAGFALLWLWLGRELIRTARQGQDAAFAFTAAVAIAVLPLNTSHPIYGSFWSSIAFWLLAVGLAVRHADTPAARRLPSRDPG